MRIRIVFDLGCIAVLYVVYWVVVYVGSLPEYNWPSLFGIYPPSAVLDEETFLLALKYWALIGMSTSFIAVLAWYALGEWGPKPHEASRGTWLLLWLVCIALTLLGGFVALFLGPQPSEGIAKLAALYLGGGVLFLYLATMLFSPINVKFVVPGSRWIRRW
jgi:hypothetical protein